MKLILDDGTEVPIVTNNPEFVQNMLDATEALIETNEQWLATRERQAEAIRKHIFTLRREYDALGALKDAIERHNERMQQFAEDNNLLNTQRKPDNE